MNKTIVIVGGVIVVVAMIIAGVFYFRKNNIDIPILDDTTIPITNNNVPVVVPQAGVPLVVTNQTVYPTDTTAIVKGDVNPKGVFTNYWFEYGTTSSLGNKTSNQSIGSGFSTISAPGYITNLTKNTVYSFRLVAENQYGRIAGNIYQFKTTLGTPSPVGSFPTVKTLIASDILRTTAKLNGEITPNKAATDYWFEYGKSTELGNVSKVTFVGDASVKTLVSFSLSELTPETKYYFRLNAQNKFGTVNGSILNFITSGPGLAKEPSVLTVKATDISGSGATLHGSVNPNLASTKYWFEYGTDLEMSPTLSHSTEKKSITAGGSVVLVNAVLTGLNPKTSHYFRLVAENNLGITRGETLTFKTK